MEIVIEFTMEIATEVVLETVNEVSMESSLKLSWKLILKLSWKFLFLLRSVVEIVVSRGRTGHLDFVTDTLWENRKNLTMKWRVFGDSVCVLLKVGDKMTTRVVHLVVSV
jgi:hypothetical protein